MERARLIWRVDGTHMHSVLGQRARLVCRDHGDGAERLDGVEPPHDGLALGEPLDAHGQRQCQHGGQPLGNRGDRQRHREQHDLTEAADTFDDDAANRQNEPQPQYRNGDLVAERAEPALQRRLADLDAADHGCETAHRAVRAGLRHLDVALPRTINVPL